MEQKKIMEINATKNVDLGWNAEYFKSFEFFLSLSTWTVWKGRKIGHWKMNSPGR